MRTTDFMRIARLCAFLGSSSDKGDKVLEIKAARDDGVITEDEAIDLAIEFC